MYWIHYTQSRFKNGKTQKDAIASPIVYDLGFHVQYACKIIIYAAEPWVDDPIQLRRRGCGVNF